MSAMFIILSAMLVATIILFIFTFDRYHTSFLHEKLTRAHTGDIRYLQNRWAKFFRNPEYLTYMPYEIRFKYYGGTWVLNGKSELYWVCSHFRGIEKERPTYKSSWNYWRHDFKSMLYIMQNHPNLVLERNKLKPEDYKPAII